MRRQRQARIGAVIATCGALLSLACGDDEPAKAQSVFWLSLRPAQGASTTRSYELPDGARDTLISETAAGERVVEGDDGLVECLVQDTGDQENFLISLRLQSGSVGNFRASGQLSKMNGGTLDVNFTITGSALEADGCTAQVETLIPGALWVNSLECTGLKDASSPNLACDATGGLIFENCSR